MTKIVEVVPYNPAWVDLFEMESTLIKQALGEICVDVHHIGSTSVQGLCAKPIIDIIAVVKTREIIPFLEKIGYTYKGEINIPFRLYFTKKTDPAVHLHVYEEENPEIKLNLLFRDFLRQSAVARQEYTEVKHHLVAAQSLGSKSTGRFSDYTLGKSPFIQKILEQAGFNEVCMKFCTHHAEWEAAQGFRQQYFSGQDATQDPYPWPFDHKDHVHFVLYQGIKIVGYAHIQLWPEEARAALRLMVIDENNRDQELGRHFLALCERWLSHQGICKLQTELVIV